MKVYLRNPYFYPSEFTKTGHRYLSFDFGTLKRRRVDPVAFARSRFPTSHFEVLVVANEGTALYTEASKDEDSPVGVFPTWIYERHGWEGLEGFCDHPVGEDDAMLNDEDIPKRFRPVSGQPNRILIYKTPDPSYGASNFFYRRLAAIMEAHPEVEFILHDSVSYKVMFMLGFAGATFNPRLRAQVRNVNLPNGRKVHVDEFDKDPRNSVYVKLLGYRKSDLMELSGRLSYNIDSVLWASKNFVDQMMLTEGIENDDIDILDLAEDDPELRAVRLNAVLRGGVRRVVSPTDGVACDTCSLSIRCGYYLEGSVCGVPKGDYSKLAKMFGTRDVSAVIDGLAKMGEIQANRLMKDLEEEDVNDERTPDVDRRIKMLTDHGIKFAKILDPNLNGKGATVNIGVIGGGGAPMIQQTTPQELIAGMVRELESRGIAREDITPAAISGLLEAVSSRHGAQLLDDAIDAEVIDIEVTEDE